MILEHETCGDCISRSMAIKAMEDLEQEDIDLYGCHIQEGFDGRRAVEVLKSLPSIFPKKKSGHWMRQALGYQCSNCTLCTNEKGRLTYNYCPNCGAKMD